MKEQQCIQILGLSGQPTLNEIKKAYRILAKKYHPDLNSSSNSEFMFKKITEAFYFLSNHMTKRKRPEDILKKEEVKKEKEQEVKAKKEEEEYKLTEEELIFIEEYEKEMKNLILDHSVNYDHGSLEEEMPDIRFFLEKKNQNVSLISHGAKSANSHTSKESDNNYFRRPQDSHNSQLKRQQDSHISPHLKRKKIEDEISNRIFLRMQEKFKKEFEERKLKKSVFKTGTFLLYLFPLIFMGATTIVLMAGSVISFGSMFYIVFMSLFNYNFAQSIGLVLFAIGGISLISILLLVLGTYSFRLCRLIKNQFQYKEKLKRSKYTTLIRSEKFNKVKIIWISILFGLLTFGTIGTFSTNKTLGMALINKKLINTQVDYIDLGDEVTRIRLRGLDKYTLWDVKITKDTETIDEGWVKIIRKHNTKSSSKIQYRFETDYSIPNAPTDFNVSFPWNEYALFNFGNEFEIVYNGNYKFI